MNKTPVDKGTAIGIAKSTRLRRQDYYRPMPAVRATDRAADGSDNHHGGRRQMMSASAFSN